MRNTVKDWHRCGECKWHDRDRKACFKDMKRGSTYTNIDPDLEACSDFIPKKGWRE